MHEGAQQVRQRNSLSRAFVANGDTVDFERNVKNGCALISTDSPASYGHHSVFLRDEVGNDSLGNSETLTV